MRVPLDFLANKALHCIRQQCKASQSKSELELKIELKLELELRLEAATNSAVRMAFALRARHPLLAEAILLILF